MQKLSIEELATVISESEIISTENHSGMRINEINHPVHGNAVTVQGNDGGLLIIK
jgi:hypothetical protein